jgi:hypothetical protein
MIKEKKPNMEDSTILVETQDKKKTLQEATILFVLLVCHIKNDRGHYDERENIQRGGFGNPSGTQQ